MPYNGSGGFSYPANSFNPAIGGTTISSADNNSILSDAETAFSMVQTVDGQSTITNNLPMSGFKHTGVNPNSGSTSRTEYTSGGTTQDNVIMDAGLTTGTSTVYAATLSPAITAYVDKSCYRVIFDKATGATPTINFNSVGAKKIYQSIGGSAVQITTNDIPANYPAILRYDSTLDASAGAFWLMNPPSLNINSLTATTTVDYYNDKFPIYDTSASANRSVIPSYLVGLLRGHLWGLTLSINVSDATNDIDIAVGEAVDNTNFALMVLSSALTKRIDAAWAVGTNQGMLATGVAVTNTTYHIFLIMRPDTGVVDIAADTSATGANIPTNTNAAYTLRRRIGSIVRSGGSNRAFVQNGDEFIWDTAASDVNTSNPGTSAVTRTLTVPIGIVVNAILSAYTTDVSTAHYTLFTSLDQTDSVPSTNNFTIPEGTSTQAGFSNRTFKTNTSGQIRTRQSASGASDDFVLLTLGYIDNRGRLS